MTTPLVITGSNTVPLDGFIDGSNELQLQYDNDSLGDHGDVLEAKHESLSSPSATIRITLVDFAHGGSGWRITAAHQADGTVVPWSRSTDHSYCDLGATTDALEVTLTATSDASPPVIKKRKVWLTTKPVDAQPDRP